jgi:hypothetical protein
MTIVAAWVRQSSQTKELVIASDSMLTGGMEWDCGPKLFPLHRGDAVLAFAGATVFAYPLIQQVLNWSEDYDRARNRSQDLCDLKGHIERTCQDMLSTFKADPQAFDWRTDFRLMLAGYSWQLSKFRIWTSRAEASRWILVHAPSRLGAVMMGDEAPRALEALARQVRPGGKRAQRLGHPSRKQRTSLVYLHPAVTALN